MKRSHINDVLKEADDFIRSFGFHLPPFAYLSPTEMKQRRKELDGVIGARLGWDVTDYGEGRFDELGMFLFTVRNGSLDDPQGGVGMGYAEKIMISRRDQISPMHRHIVKTEDIINRGGADLAIKMYASDADGNLDEKADVVVVSDGVAVTLSGGGTLVLKPGASVTLSPGNWHEFWGEGGDALVGEVSTVNDDMTDNIFHRPIGRFADIEEDAEPVYLLVSDYERWLS
ncbi:MAG: D-lyxose/D-mannose family sugar isomerase [Pseudomonadota bacterium]